MGVDGEEAACGSGEEHAAAVTACYHIDVGHGSVNSGSAVPAAVFATGHITGRMKLTPPQPGVSSQARCAPAAELKLKAHMRGLTPFEPNI